MGGKIKFRFRPLGDDGRPTGLFSRPAYVDQEKVVLDDREIPLRMVRMADRAPQRLILYLDGETEPLVVAFAGGHAHKVRTALNIRFSAQRARWHQQELNRLGRGNIFRSFECPHCGFTNELSGHLPTPQSYCMSCDTVVTTGEARLQHEERYHLCGTCRRYGGIRRYSSARIIFLIVFVHFEVGQFCECTTCMRRRTWSALWANLPFIVGVPPALWQLVRAYWPTDDPLSSLDRTNRLAEREPEEAAQLYELIEQRVQFCSPVLYNHGAALFAVGRLGEAARKLEHALRICANFGPAFALLTECYRSLGAGDSLETMLSTWARAELLRPKFFSVIRRNSW